MLGLKGRKTELQAQPGVGDAIAMRALARAKEIGNPCRPFWTLAWALHWSGDSPALRFDHSNKSESGGEHCCGFFDPDSDLRRKIGFRRLRLQQYLTRRLSSFQRLMGLGGFPQRIDPVDVNLQTFFRNPL